MANNQPDEYDSPWKEVIETYFQDFMAFFFPQAHAEINWSRNYESLDNELQQIVRDAEIGMRQVDKLIKVWLQNGEEVWVLVHIEVQSKSQSSFAKRMYTYNYRIFDRYERQVASLAVLADDEQNWRPNSYSYTLFGCRASLEFPIVKLLDYDAQWSELEQSSNPFSVVVMAHLKAKATRRDKFSRLQWKLRLVRGLYERGYERQDILELFRFIDWVMRLPEDLEDRFDEEISRYQEEQQMPYITSIERRAMARGELQGRLENAREAVIEVLKTRFEVVPQSMVEVINELNDLSVLKSLLRQAITIASLSEFQEFINSIRSESEQS